MDGGLSGVLLGIGVLQAVVYLFFVRAIDLYEREELRYDIPVFIWGLTAAVVVSFFFNTLLEVMLSAFVGQHAASLLEAVLGAPVVEECAKGFALLIAFAIAYMVYAQRGSLKFSGVVDGIGYGSAAGFGFSMVEDVFYYVQFGPETYAAGVSSVASVTRRPPRSPASESASFPGCAQSWLKW